MFKHAPLPEGRSLCFVHWPANLEKIPLPSSKSIKMIYMENNWEWKLYHYDIAAVESQLKVNLVLNLQHSCSLRRAELPAWGELKLYEGQFILKEQITSADFVTSNNPTSPPFKVSCFPSSFLRAVVAHWRRRRVSSRGCCGLIECVVLRVRADWQLQFDAESDRGGDGEDDEQPFLFLSTSAIYHSSHLQLEEDWLRGETWIHFISFTGTHKHV